MTNTVSAGSLIAFIAGGPLAFLILIVLILVALAVSWFIRRRKERLDPYNIRGRLINIKPQLKRMESQSTDNAMRSMYEGAVIHFDAAERAYKNSQFKEALNHINAANRDIDAFDALLSRQHHPTNPDNF